MGFVQTKTTACRAPSARPGSIVTVEDRFGRLVEYELLGEDDDVPARHRVRPGSPAALALHDARAGDVLWFPEGDGRPRRFIVHDVVAPPGPRGS